jgi:putative ABC transport system permease protein
MHWIAWRMLTGDRAKYLGIIFGITFAALLMGQQASIFCGLMRNTASQIRDIKGADIWVMDPSTQFVDDLKSMSENEVYRVRGVEGVLWAVRLYKGLARAKMDDGKFQQVILIGLDDASMVGAPTKMLSGDLADLRRPDAVVIDLAGWQYLWGDEPFVAGRQLEMNDRRAVIVGLCESSPTFQTFPIVYTRYSQAVRFIPRERKVLSFVLAQPRPGADAADVCARIKEKTGLLAMHRDDFFWMTVNYFLRRTGIPINFGITVVLGFVVGSAIAGQTFYLFTIENLKQFGALKAMGLSNLRITGMILQQSFTVGLFGYCLGIGGAVLMGKLMGIAAKGIPPAFFMPWQVMAVVAVGVIAIAMISALLSIQKVIFLEPAVVFR